MMKRGVFSGAVPGCFSLFASVVVDMKRLLCSNFLVESDRLSLHLRLEATGALVGFMLRRGGRGGCGMLRAVQGVFVAMVVGYK